MGATLTLPMDIRIAADTARFGFVFARRGLVPEAGSAWFLPQIVGFSQAMRWCLSGRVFDANEALSGGLISEAVAQDALLDRAVPCGAPSSTRWSHSSAPTEAQLLRFHLRRLAGLEMLGSEAVARVSPLSRQLAGQIARAETRAWRPAAHD